MERYHRAHDPPPPRRARRRVETPPGAQGQADWAHFKGVVIARRAVDLLGFHLQLSWSRFAAVVWSLGKDQLAWQEVHIACFGRVGGVPATVRVDNERTAVARGAGAWGEHNPAYRRFAERARFHIDLCPPRAPVSNAMCESFFATLECELLDRSTFRTHGEARRGIFRFIEGWYNPHRRHSALGQISPAELERRHAEPARKAA